jgi:hypothetical protein
MLEHDSGVEEANAKLKTNYNTSDVGPAGLAEADRLDRRLAGNATEPLKLPSRLQLTREAFRRWLGLARVGVSGGARSLAGRRAECAAGFSRAFR